MKKSARYFSLVILGSIAGCILGDILKCKEMLPMDEVNALRDEGNLLPDPEKLAPICNDLEKAYECYADALMKDPSKFSEENEIIIQGVEASFNYLCRDLMKERSYYKEVAKCLKAVSELQPSCESAAKEGYNLYKLSNENELPKEKKCFEDAHLVGCLAVHVQKMCGTRGRYIYQNFMDEGRFLAAVCEPETVEALKTKYLDHLKLDEEVRKIYEETFETARRRTGPY